jgi:hypothetical protein
MLEACLRHDARSTRLPGMTVVAWPSPVIPESAQADIRDPAMCGAASAFTCARLSGLAGVSPEVCKEPRERGHQTTAIRFCNSRQSSGARVRWSAVPRVQHRRQRASGPARRLQGAGLSSLRTFGGCAPEVMDAGAPLTKGFRASHCWGRPASISSPGI